MAQLVVRNLDERLVARLRARAAAHGHSMEEEHRYILREALLGPGAGTKRTLKDHLASMPDVGDDALFERRPARNRDVDL